MDPKIEINSEGYYGLASDSPAIDGSEAGYTLIPSFDGLDFDNDILLDLMKEARPATITSKDVGCVEFPHAALIQPIATENTTGPSYFNPTLGVDTPSIVSRSAMDINLFLDPSTNELNLIFKNDSPIWLEMSLFNLAGKKIKTLVDTSLAPGENIIRQDTSTLPLSLYVVTGTSRDLVSGKKQIHTVRFVNQ